MRGCGGRPTVRFPAAGWPRRKPPVFGGLLVLPGTALLLHGGNVLAAGVALVTFVLYVFVYTPLKTLDDAQHGDRRDSGRLASGDRLGGRDRPAGGGGVGACS